MAFMNVKVRNGINVLMQFDPFGHSSVSVAWRLARSWLIVDSVVIKSSLIARTEREQGSVVHCWNGPKESRHRGFERPT